MEPRTSMSVVGRTIVVSALAAGCIAGLVPSASLRASARGADADLSGLQQRIDRLEVVTQRVEALSSIKRLQHAYGHYAELGLWHDFADLFADTGIGHYTQGARASVAGCPRPVSLKVTSTITSNCRPS